jgi:hypothetical protein
MKPPAVFRVARLRSRRKLALLATSSMIHTTSVRAVRSAVRRRSRGQSIGFPRGPSSGIASKHLVVGE